MRLQARQRAMLMLMWTAELASEKEWASTRVGARDGVGDDGEG